MKASDVTPQWLSMMMARYGVRQKTLAAYLGIDQAAVSRTKKGARKITPAEAEAIIEFFEKRSAGELIDSAGDEFPSVPRYRVKLSGGPGRSIFDEEEADRIPFTQDFIRKLKREGTKGLAIFEADGDSMEPTISTGDLVMVDTERRSTGGGIMAYRLGDEAFIKRIMKTPEGFQIISDNRDDYPAFTIGDNELGDFEIIGRVCWIGRTV